MKIGILDENIVKKIATDILVDRPEVISVFVEGTELIIESGDINSLVRYLETEHGLHLILNGSNYMIASQINEDQAETLAQKAAAKAGEVSEAGANAANNVEEDDSRNKTTAEKAKEAKKDAQNTSIDGDTKGAAIDDVRSLAARAKKEPAVVQTALRSKELMDILTKDPKFVDIIKNISNQSPQEQIVDLAKQL